MTENEGERRLLRSALAESHRSAGDRIPPFPHLWSRAAAEVAPTRRVRRRRIVLASAVLTLALAATIAWWGADRQRADELERALAIATAAGEWQAPLDFLLETPGREWLEAAPRWQPDPALEPWLAAPDLIQQGDS